MLLRTVFQLYHSVAREEAQGEAVLNISHFRETTKQW